MSPEAVPWTYALAPDVMVDARHGGAFLRTAINKIWIEGSVELEVLRLLTGAGSSEPEIYAQLALTEIDRNNATRCAALLFRLDRLGLLARGLNNSGRHLASCIPVRPPPPYPPQSPPEGTLRLSPRALARADVNVNAVSLEVPGFWARITFHDRNLLPLLHDLAVGRGAAELAAAASVHSENAIILAVVSLMSWCGLLDCDGPPKWSTHDLLFHARTRKGYARILLGKTYPDGAVAAPLAPSANMNGRGRLALKPPDLTRLLNEDRPYAWVSEQRKSLRRQGSAPLTLDQLSEFLFRTLHERAGRRPYPSGGACYPLKCYLAVHHCLDIVPGLYAYDSSLHELITVGEAGPGFNELLGDAANAASVERPPQILLVLAAHFGRTERVYGDLSYSLILKEVGAVFQVAMMAAAAMGLSTCPLGSGNSLLFSELLGVNPLVESSVGELMIGSLEENV